VLSAARVLICASLSLSFSRACRRQARAELPTLPPEHPLAATWTDWRDRPRTPMPGQRTRPSRPPRSRGGVSARPHRPPPKRRPRLPCLPARRTIAPCSVARKSPCARTCLAAARWAGKRKPGPGRARARKRPPCRRAFQLAARGAGWGSGTAVGQGSLAARGNSTTKVEPASDVLSTRTTPAWASIT